MTGKELLEKLASGELRLSVARMTPDPNDAAHMDNIVRAISEAIAIGVRAAPNGDGKRVGTSVPLVLLPEMAGAALKMWLIGCDTAIDEAVARVMKG